VTDLWLLALWLGVLIVGLGAVLLGHAHGWRTTSCRDVLHIGASVWLVGWPWWRSALVPMLVVTSAAATTALLPWLARRVSSLRRIERAVSDDDERWAGLTHYTLAFVFGTALALMAGRALVAGGALLALSWGDGVGGWFGKRYGRHRFAFPWAKPKTYEGSLAVALAALAGLIGWSHYLDVQLSWPVALGAAAVAATAEAAAPRGTDNLLVPAATAAWLYAWTEV
jgi:dolichol kinase